MKTKTSNAASAVRLQRQERVLVVVDMQPGFRASCNEATLSAVEREIRSAVEAGDAIVILEYKKYPATHARLLELVDGVYERHAVVTKKDDDGSEELVDACLEHGFPGGKFRFCGVNTHACVMRTVLGLSNKLDDSRIDVVKAACNDENGNCWEEFPSSALVHLV